MNDVDTGVAWHASRLNALVPFDHQRMRPPRSKDAVVVVIAIVLGDGALRSPVAGCLTLCLVKLSMYRLTGLGDARKLYASYSHGKPGPHLFVLADGEFRLEAHHLQSPHLRSPLHTCAGSGHADGLLQDGSQWVVER